MQEIQGIKVFQDTNIEDIEDTNTRRPYYRIRGPRVTEQQAFEIIRKTDNVISNTIGWSESRELGFLYIQHFDNNWFTKNSGCSPQGWCHPNGIIGCNYHTDKNPMMEEYLCDLIDLIKAFPFLDMIIAITDWDELPPYAWEKQWNTDFKNYKAEEFYMDYPDFIENIEIGFWIHDGVLEILSKARAQRVYREYEERYEEPNKDLYVCIYYEDNHIFPADFEYLRKMVAAYGLDPDEKLERYSWRDWLEGRPEGKPPEEASTNTDNIDNLGSGLCIIGS